MSDRPDRYSPAWRPLTPRGVANFARASLGRLLLVQLVVALITAGFVVCAVLNCWFPAITAAIDRLPTQGAIVDRELDWRGQSPMDLAESRCLGVAVDLEHRGLARSTAHVQVEFGRRDVRIYSMLGRLDLVYPKSYTVALNEQELKPWWGAWAPPILALIGLGVMSGLVLSWTLLATAYCVPAWLLGLYLNRDLSFSGSWRLAGAALMPGALFMAAGIALYTWARLDLIHLLAVFVFHFVLSWAYLFLGALAAPRLDSVLAPKTNPFQQSPAGSGTAAVAHETKGQSNPFRPSGP